MWRREAITLLTGSAIAAAQAGPKSLTRYFGGAAGAAVLLDFHGRQTLAVHNASSASGALGPPGSTIKPFTLSALLRAGKLNAKEMLPCPGKLALGGHSLNCTHPPLGSPVCAETALAYSCNCFVAHMAARLEAEELAASLERAGFAGVRRAGNREAVELQGLGEAMVMSTVATLALAYRGLAMEPLAPVIAGLEGAVEYGTAQLAKVEGVKLAGKTGSVRTAEGLRTAWFAGFAPSRKPEVVVTVMVHGNSGGSDAAPIAGKILRAWRAGEV